MKKHRLPTDPAILMKWVNALLQSQYESLEDLRNGIVYCRLLDSLYPNCIDLHSLHPHPKSRWESNYKELTRSLGALGMRPQVNVRDLILGSYVDSICLLHFFIDLYNVHIGLSSEEKGSSSPQKEVKGSAIQELYKWFKGLVFRSDTESTNSASGPRRSGEQVKRDFERQVMLLMFEPVSDSETDRQKGGGKPVKVNPLEKQRQREEQCREQRRKDHIQLKALVEACQQLKSGQQLMQRLWLQSRRERGKV
ncbi:hypothetical protein KR009_002119 [Drosophila setifemur]|nr:hypothetical protein KR009_002119 [Drosophila setifemur]